MTDVIGARALTTDFVAENARPVRTVGGSLALVIVFWWLATGLTFAMQRADELGAASRSIMPLFAIGGAWLVLRTRKGTGVRSVRLAFLGAALLWWWSASLLYAGWGVQMPLTANGPHGSLSLAIQAVQSTFWVDSISLAVIVALLALSWRAANTMALQSFLVFWGTLQTAKLNEFFGVKNPGTELLPESLSGLKLFFGPAQNSWFLAASLVMLISAAALLFRQARRARYAHERHASIMLSALFALAVIEHAVLAVPVAPWLWTMFLKVRAG